MSNTLSEADKVTKSEGGENFPAGDYAYVPDPQAPSTWKLRLTATPGGPPDSGIVGAAIAALGKGFRGNKVQIPAADLPAVKAKVRAAWKKANPDKKPEDMPPAIKESAAAVAECGPYGMNLGDLEHYVPDGIYSFAQLDQLRQTNEAAEELQEVASDFIQLGERILMAPPDALPDKAAALHALVGEIVARVPQIATSAMSAPAESAVAEAATIKSRVKAAIKALDELLADKEIPASVASGVKSLRETFHKTWADLASETAGARESEPVAEHFAESYGGVTIAEDATNPNPARGPLKMNVELIQPGWGNTRDNHYYQPDMLKQYAQVFEGVKMYATDHKQGEKSVRTEVSRIDKIAGFSAKGAPIAEVTVFDPDFAEQVRNRAKVNALDSLECSILGDGTSRPFEKDGRKGKLIESIVKNNALGVDWVTRAGAGGRAIAIAESANPQLEGGNMPDQEIDRGTTQLGNLQAAAVGEQAATTAPAEPTKLSELEVTTLLEAEKRLPAASRVRLAERQYANGDAVQAAITGELAYLKEVMGSGQPFALGSSPVASPKTPTERLAEADAALDAVSRKFGMSIGGVK